MEAKTGGAAFPENGVFNSAHGDYGRVEWGYQGMTLRDYFAAAVIPALVKSNEEWGRDHPLDCTPIKALAHEAYEIADAMIAARDWQ